MQELIYQKLKKVTDFPTINESYSPMFSSIGLGIRNTENGIGEMWFNYNRASRAVFDKTVELPYALNSAASCIYKLVFGSNSNATLTFWKNDGFMLEIDGEDEINLFTKTSEHTIDFWLDSCDGEYLILKGHSLNLDKRDPDEVVPFAVGVRALYGKLSAENGYKAIPKKGKLILAFYFEALKVRVKSVMNMLKNCPESVKQAALLSRRWVRNYSANYSYEAPDGETAELCAKAIRGLLFNATKAQGNLESHVSAFPSRGGYPCSFLWDTYFQNFGYSLLGSDLNKDFLRQIASCMRSDGKFPQFSCSTWDRPGETQPALFGWAVMNSMGDSFDFAWEMLPIIEANNDWWLTSRMTAKGLVYCPHGLETGQDNSPRFDNGATLAVDMNSYLLNQLRMTAKLEKMLGLEDKAKFWDEQADKLSQNIMTHLFSKSDHIFYDINFVTGERVKVIGASSFLPLWAGVPLDKKQTDKILKKYLLSSKCMLGDIPFPSVAYNDKNYNSSDWWRGPVWMPTAWLMLETLERLGLNNERKNASEKLLKMLMADKEMHELFDSKTGKGLGNPQQGWTCALFLKLLAER